MTGALGWMNADGAWEQKSCTNPGSPNPVGFAIRLARGGGAM